MQALGRNASGDDIGGQFVLNQRNPVFQRQFLLFQTFDCELIGGRALGQGVDGFVEVTVFAAQVLELEPQNFLMVHLMWGQFGHESGSKVAHMALIYSEDARYQSANWSC